MTNIYTIKVTLDEFEDTFWREIQVSSNNTVAKLAYIILVAYGANASHLFNLQYDGKRYELTSLPFATITADTIDATRKKLNSLDLSVGSVIAMEYDYGAGWGFKITVEKIEPMVRGQQKRYPLIIDGAGNLPISDDGPDVLAEMIEATDAGNIPYFYDVYTGNEYEVDYREYNPDFTNELLKYDVDMIQMAYEHPEELEELIDDEDDADGPFV